MLRDTGSDAVVLARVVLSGNGDPGVECVMRRAQGGVGDPGVEPQGYIGREG
jgi:hypothetical protein